MLCLALGGVCLQVVIGERLDEVERLTLAVLCLHLGVACGPGWFVSVSVYISCDACGRCCVSSWCGTGICGISGVFPWVVSGCECCVLLLGVCLSKL